MSTGLNLGELLDKFDDDTADDGPADMMQESIAIDVDEIHDKFGMPYVYKDIVNREYGLGSLSKIYTMIVHPVLSALFNEAADADERNVKEFFRRLSNLRRDEQLGNLVHDQLENRIWEAVNNSSHIVQAKNQDILILCICMVELLIPQIRDYALDFAKRQGIPLGADAYIQIGQHCTAELVPKNNPDSLIIHLNYGWVYV